MAGTGQAVTEVAIDISETCQKSPAEYRGWIQWVVVSSASNYCILTVNQHLIKINNNERGVSNYLLWYYSLSRLSFP